MSPHLRPLPSSAHPTAHNLPNAGNTCYISAVLTALFADYDALDALLINSNPLTTALLPILNALRTGTSTSVRTVASLRDALQASGWTQASGQQDAVELLCHLLDVLEAPYIPLLTSISHDAPSESGDFTAGTERVVWLYPRDDVSIGTLIDEFFFKERRHLHRAGASVDGELLRTLIPSYTSVRETGDVVLARRENFDILTVPFALARFKAGKWRGKVSIPPAIDASPYVRSFADGMTHTLVLRSVICHRGNSINSGHYVTYTYSTRAGWRRWDDLERQVVESSPADVKTGAPERREWANEICRDSYLAFYELLPGDELRSSGNISCQVASDRRVAARAQSEEDARLARQTQAEEDRQTAEDVTLEELLLYH